MLWFEAVVTDSFVKTEMIGKPAVGTCPHCKGVRLKVPYVTWSGCMLVIGCVRRVEYV